MPGPTARPDPAAALVRRAGRLTDPDGRPRLWAVAEGVRGRRWRERWTSGEGAVALLLEVDPGGRWHKLELAGPAGLLTLHPEPVGAMVHGNLVTVDGVRHLAMPAGDEVRLHVAGSLVTAAVLAADAGSLIGVGEGCRRPGLLVLDGGEIVATELVVSCDVPDRWTIEADGMRDRVRLDAAGLPSAEDAESWPLELGSG